MREAGLAILAGSMLWAARTGRGLMVGLLGAAGAALAAVGTALLGHPMGGTLTTAVTGAVHVLAAGGWAGSVLVAAIALVPARGGADRAGQARLLLKAFAVLAAACLSTLVVTGLLLTGAQVATVDALLTTPYGLILLAKVAAIGVAGLLGLRTARHLRRSGRPVPRRGLIAEAAVLAGVLVLAGTLAAAGPARGPRFPVASRIATVPEVSGQVADLMDSVTIRPNRPGRNVVTVTVADTRRPAPGPVTGVSVQLTSPDGTQIVHPVTRTADNWTVAVDEIRASGQWRVAVTVMRDGLSPVTDTHSWAVAQPQTGPVATVVSTAPLQPAIGTLAGLLAGAVSVAALVFGYRRRFRGGPARLSVWVASR
jgi:copper transport protein